jgi:hypothetical protein
MRNYIVSFIIRLLSLAIFSALLSCATDKAPLKFENSLSQEKLAYYNESFDKMREDLWDRVGFLYRQEQVQNFKQADMRFDNGKLIIRTKTGSFSKGGLSSRYALRGDFDISLDFRMDFIKGLSGMDQVFVFAVIDKSLTKGKISNATMGLSMKEGLYVTYLFGHCFINGKRKKGNSKKVKNFNGTFRIQRKGEHISTLYKIADAAEWSRLNTFRVSNKDMIIGFQLRNFFSKRTSIQAEHSISAEFDSLKINAAQQIIEDEI